MNISLTPDLEAIINEQIKSGLYNSPNEVIRESLRLLKEQDELKRLRREELRKEIMKGVEDMKEGRYKTYNSGEEIANEIIQRGQEKLKAQQK